MSFVRAPALFLYTPCGFNSRLARRWDNPGVLVFLTLMAALALAGALARRWWFALTPLVVWPIIYLGMSQGWWLDGLGDGWPVAAVSVTLMSLVLTAVGIALGQGFTRS